MFRLKQPLDEHVATALARYAQGLAHFLGVLLVEVVGQKARRGPAGPRDGRAHGDDAPPIGGIDLQLVDDPLQVVPPQNLQDSTFELGPVHGWPRCGNTEVCLLHLTKTAGEPFFECSLAPIYRPGGRVASLLATT